MNGPAQNCSIKHLCYRSYSYYSWCNDGGVISYGGRSILVIATLRAQRDLKSQVLEVLIISLPVHEFEEYMCMLLVQNP